MADPRRHWLAANWQTWCGLIVDFPIEPVTDVMRPKDNYPRTIARTHRGLLVTYVRADVDCQRCCRSIKMLYPDGT